MFCNLQNLRNASALFLCARSILLWYTGGELYLVVASNICRYQHLATFQKMTRGRRRAR